MAAILADTIFRCILVNEMFCISLKIVHNGPIKNNPALA